ncbi:MAG: ABC transporter permease subunit [Planctomycetia bacterium]|nr:ABC transporter permease subunit [Planctomycetia bacterium]
MPPQSTFTGRSRRRKTHPWVKAGDSLARAVITLGGIGTILAVLAVAVFLLAVALPLFQPARLTSERASSAMAAPAASSSSGSPSLQGVEKTVATCLGADETGVVAWLFDAHAVAKSGDPADAGLVRVFSIADGKPLLTRTAAECGIAHATTISMLPGSIQAVVGFDDGSFRIGRLGLESTFLAADSLPPVAVALASGEAGAHEDAIIVRGHTGQYATVRMVTEFDAPASTSLQRPVIDADITLVSGGPLVAALDAKGQVRVETISSRRNLLTDELVTTASGSTIDTKSTDAKSDAKSDVTGNVGGFVPRFVRVSELGDQLFLVAEDGAARRYEIRDVESPVLMESFDAVPDQLQPDQLRPDRQKVTCVARVFGGNALAVGDSAGVVRVFFATRAVDAAATDGLQMAVAKVFASVAGSGPDHGITALAPSPRSRLLAVADASGGIRLVQTTTGATAATLAGDDPGGLEAPARQLLIAPRENRLLAADGARLAAWTLNAGYPEVSWRSLFGRVWYEKYPGHVHAWETTGHESFESKFGLVPLIFGTLKATLYSMLFATPIAILAAIFASQFMHPSWKARIKPTIEMMASLPSVVLGFVAGLIFAPIIEHSLMTVLAGFFGVPLTLLTGAFFWQLLPVGWRSRYAAWRFLLIAAVALPAGAAVAAAAAAPMERLLFNGDVAAWLDGRGGSGFGGWVLALLPLAGVLSAMLVGRFVNPWLRRNSRGWSQQQAAIASLGTFAVGIALALALAIAAASFFDALRLDTRGGLFGTYVQRNALIVAIGMSFAIIPLIFTIADDALSSVPDHLRSASLGAGATPWQTAIRVIVPAAASGLFSAVMIGLGRAVGETMIVLMAAGNTPLMGWNLFNGFQTLSAAIATELPEAARGSAHYRVLFLAALTLFGMTFVVNTAAEIIRQRFRRRSHEL